MGVAGGDEAREFGFAHSSFGHDQQRRTAGERRHELIFFCASIALHRIGTRARTTPARERLALPSPSAPPPFHRQHPTGRTGVAQPNNSRPLIHHRIIIARRKGRGGEWRRHRSSSGLGERGKRKRSSEYKRATDQAKHRRFLFGDSAGTPAERVRCRVTEDQHTRSAGVGLRKASKGCGQQKKPPTGISSGGDSG